MCSSELKRSPNGLGLLKNLENILRKGSRSLFRDTGMKCFYIFFATLAQFKTFKNNIFHFYMLAVRAKMFDSKKKIILKILYFPKKLKTFNFSVPLNGLVLQKEK